MNRATAAIVPGLVIGCLFLIAFTRWIASPSLTVQAAGEEMAALTPTPVPETEAGATSETETGERDCSISLRFPDKVRRWCSLIERYAAENGLDPNLIAAVILQESGGNPEAYSKSGAVGLMQVMPRDGLAASFMCKNGPCFASRPSMEELFDPEFNIAYGTRMLAGLIQRTGDVREALRAYGPINVGYYYADIVLRIYETYR
ncbi:transglycosylase SLT domain-containing protein [uncultured Thermanaerothrix sp.]|uniref:transglycosylase SLT domain-containing protein n=1 Tax=uncultured Thermanaerothrix sp. TaxID=1195149 RepID=UPI00260EAD20|nr:transglycosylase SLT domain-containing protein [uncultured Thermanaerothrix sp.]